MNIDNLHDALGLLDDDLIEEVDALRSERKQHSKSNDTKWVIRWGTLAACLGVFLVSVYAISLLWSNGFGGAKNSAKMDTAAESESIEEDSGDSARLQDDVVIENKSEVTDASGAGGSSAEVPSVLVEIKAWQEDGFAGTIAGIVDTEKYAIGTEVTVKFSEGVYAEESSVTGVQHTENTPDSENFPIGSIVNVQFYLQEATTPSTENDAISEEIVLYAESVAPADAE